MEYLSIINSIDQNNKKDIISEARRQVAVLKSRDELQYSRGT